MLTIQSQPNWLTCGWRFTHKSGHPSAAGQAQDRESSPAGEIRTFYHCATQPTDCKFGLKQLHILFYGVVRSIFRYLAPSRRNSRGGRADIIVANAALNYVAPPKLPYTVQQVGCQLTKISYPRPITL